MYNQLEQSLYLQVFVAIFKKYVIFAMSMYCRLAKWLPLLYSTKRRRQTPPPPVIWQTPPRRQKSSRRYRRGKDFSEKSQFFYNLQLLASCEMCMCDQQVLAVINSHHYIFLLRLSSLVPVLYTYRVSGSADGDFAVIWYNYYVAGCMQDTFARATHDDRVSCIQRRGQFRAVAKGE